MTRNTITTGLQGGECARAFDGRPDIADIEKATIERISVQYNGLVYAMTVCYTGHPGGVQYGDNRGTTVHIALDTGEYIIKIRGRAYKCHVGNLRFTSNKGNRWGPFGTDVVGAPFVWSAQTLGSGNVSPRMGLLYFRGTYGGSLGSLQATFATYPTYPRAGNAPPEIAYEHIKKAADPDGPVGLSKFATNLMSPVVTLIVGKESIVFHAYENILCRLPFFRAALKGGFKEAADKTIRMPDDEPDTVSALLEYLYIHRYTYPYHPKEFTTSGDATPAKDVAEGLFHVRVYALASKYDHQQLASVAYRGVAYIMENLMENANNSDVVLLLKEMYERDWVMAQWVDDENMAGVKAGLPKLLKEVYATQVEEVEGILSDSPALALDLLRLLALI